MQLLQKCLYNIFEQISLTKLHSLLTLEEAAGLITVDVKWLEN